uniref:SAM domain-containing protein n=1 Tax=Alexandrium monilatum TaxID=311494 RepID=A0A7S4VKA7_9DINO
MSRFSTIDAQHSAARELERQRLERKMGQLRREVEGGGAATAAPCSGDRRFQPPRRRASTVPSRCPAGRAARPGPDQGGTDRPPSIEMAWLLRASSRMEADSEEVEAFLVRHGLDRYTALLVNNEDGIGSSLEALRLADDAALAKAGLPQDARGCLLRAIQATAEGPEPPVSHRSSSSTLRIATDLDEVSSVRSTPQPSATSTSQWKCLGRAPPGWRRTEIGEDGRHRPASSGVRRVTLVDTACGDGDATVEEDEEAEDREAVPASGRPGVPLLAGTPGAMPTPLALGSRPSTAGSRPSTAGGGAAADRRGKACCYQCFRQAYLPCTAEEVRESAASAVRHFCSEDCAKRFRQVLAERDERQRELGELRGQVLQGAACSVTEESEGRCSPSARASSMSD